MQPSHIKAGQRYLTGAGQEVLVISIIGKTIIGRQTYPIEGYFLNLSYRNKDRPFETWTATGKWDVCNCKPWRRCFQSLSLVKKVTTTGDPL